MRSQRVKQRISLQQMLNCEHKSHLQSDEKVNDSLSESKKMFEMCLRFLLNRQLNRKVCFGLCKISSIFSTSYLFWGFFLGIVSGKRTLPCLLRPYLMLPVPLPSDTAHLSHISS